MEKYFGDASVLFMVMYTDLEKELKEKRWSQSIPTLNELMDNIEQEGFVTTIKDEPKFLYELYNVILNDYAKHGMGDFELSQMWKVFAKLSENGMQPFNLKTQELYLMLAKEVINNSRYGGHLDTANKTKFLIAALDSFDSSQYFFRALNKISDIKKISAFYAYYADFIKTIAEVCSYEKLAYVILAEQIQRKDAPNDGWDNSGDWISKCAKDLKEKLYYHNHFAFSEWQEHYLFGKRIEKLMDTHIESISESALKEEENELTKYPVLIKKPSKRIYLPDLPWYHTTEID